MNLKLYPRVCEILNRLFVVGFSSSLVGLSQGSAMAFEYKLNIRDLVSKDFFLKENLSNKPLSENGVEIFTSGEAHFNIYNELSSYGDIILRNPSIDIDYAGSGFVPTSFSFRYGGGSGNAIVDVDIKATSILSDFGRLTNNFGLRNVFDYKDDTLYEFYLGSPNNRPRSIYFATGKLEFGVNGVVPEIPVDVSPFIVGNQGAIVGKKEDIIIGSPQWGVFNEIEVRDSRGGQVALIDIELGFISAEKIINQSQDDFTVSPVEGEIIATASFFSDTGRVPLEVLAESMGYSHFNWLSIISNEPRGTYVFSGNDKLVVDDGEILTKTGKYFDPLFLGNKVCDSVGILTLSCNFVPGDTKDFYIDVAGFGGNDSEYLNGSSFSPGLNDDGSGLIFYDEPFQGFTSSENQPVEFTTLLVGVISDDTTYESYEPIDGFGFTWESESRCLTKTCSDRIDKVITTNKSTFSQLNRSFFKDTLGLSDQDFVFDVQVTDSSLTFNEYNPELVEFLKAQGVAFEGIQDQPKQVSETRSIFPLALLLLFSISNLAKKRHSDRY